MKEEYTVLRIDDPDFGCEGLPEGQVSMATVTLEDQNGNKLVLKQQDALLYDRDINEGNLVWLENGEVFK